jgi:hypothetical protein
MEAKLRVRIGTSVSKPNHPDRVQGDREHTTTRVNDPGVTSFSCLFSREIKLLFMININDR